MGKGSNKKASADDDVNEGADKPKFQAVVLADAFYDEAVTHALEPLESSSIHLNSIPLLEYSMDCCVGNGVDEAFVVVTNDIQEQQVRAWQAKNTPTSVVASTNAEGDDGMKHLSSSTTIMQVNIIKDTSLTTAGDALRELYKRNVIKDNSKAPFLLLFGDTISNVDVRQAVEEHQARKAKDSAAIMTLILKDVSTTSSARIVPSHQDDLMIAMDPETNRILVYDNSSPTTAGVDDDDDDDDDGAGGNAMVTLPCSFIANHAYIDLSTQYLDTGMAICSPEVLARFEDEFDYLHISADFVHNSVAEEEEGLQTRIHAHVLSGETYATRVLDFATYHEISQDLLKRWCHPIVPDNIIRSNNNNNKSGGDYMIMEEGTEAEEKKDDSGACAANCYKLSGHPYLYKTKTSIVARSSTVTGPGMLGQECHVDENCTITKSVLGNYCKIGPNCTIENSYVWDHVQVGAGAKIDQAIIAQNVVIGEDAVISPGCVIGDGCVIGKGVTVPPFTRVTLTVEEDLFGELDDDDDGDDGKDPFGGDAFDNDSGNKDEGGNAGPTKETDPSLVGSDGKGHAWKPEFPGRIPLESMGYDRLAHRSKRQEQQMSQGKDDFSIGGGVDGEDDGDLEQAFSAYTEGAVTFEDTPSMTTASSSAAPVVFGRQKGVDVIQEMKDICMEFEDTPASGDAPNMDNLAIELNSYKFSQNATYSDCTMASILAVLQKCDITKDMSDGKLVGAFTNKVKIWAPLLTKLSVGIPEERAIIYGLERAATAPGDMQEKLSSGTAFRFLLQILHDQEVLSEEAILEWATERRKGVEEDATSAISKLFQLESVQDFLEWLEESEEEDSDDDDDEDSD